MKNSLKDFAIEYLKTNGLPMENYTGNSKKALSDLKAYSLENPGFNKHYQLKEIANALSRLETL